MLMAQDPNMLINAIKAIPDVIWGVIIGSLLTWVAVYLQLRHDSKEKRLSLLRDTYLSAAEKFGQQINYLANFHNKQNNSPDGYVEAISNINILGTDETIKAVNKLNDHLNEAIMELIPLKDRISMLETEIKNYDNALQDTLLQSQKALQDMKEYHSQNVRDNSKWLNFQNDFDSAQTDGSMLQKEYQQVNEEILKLTSKLTENCQQKAQTAVELEIPIILAIRKELGTSFDEQAYREMMKISNMKWRKNLHESHISRKKVVDEFIEKWSSALSD